MSNAIQLYQGWTPADYKTLGHDIGRSAAMEFPKSELGIVILLEAAGSNRTPFQVMRRIHITPKGILMRADAMLADFMQLGGKVTWKKISEGEVDSEWEFNGQKLQVSFTIERARKAGWVRPRSAWETDPESMLVAAVTRRAIRRICPQVIVECGDADGESQHGDAPKLDLVTEKRLDAVIEVAETVESNHTVDEHTADEKAESEAGLAPASNPGAVSASTLVMLESAIGDCAPQALAYLRSPKALGGVPWLVPGQGFEHLPESQAIRLVNNPNGFKNEMRKTGFIV